MEIRFSDIILKAAPEIRTIMISAGIVNRPTSDELWHEVEEVAGSVKSRYQLSDIRLRPAIAATRNAYKALGKEPNRYRPSAEALCRRVVNGKGLYRLTTMVDIINLVSMATGYSIGGFDADRIEGDSLTLGAGMHEEEFHAIGRGLLNIEGLPVYRDAVGPIGTPTSDEERTSLSEETVRVLMLVNVYGEETPVEETIALTRRLFERYASATDFHAEVVAPKTV